MKAGIALALLVAPATAHAGRTYYGWSYGTDVVPERGVELMSSIYEEVRTDPAESALVSHATEGSEAVWWVGPLVGITDQLELALPIELAQDGMERYGAELRYRFVTADPVHAPAIVPLVRVAAFRTLTHDTDLEADAVLAYEVGRVNLLVDLGGFAEGHVLQARPGGGASVRVTDELRVGVEAHAELAVRGDDDDNWVAVGPNAAWTHGRFWLAATYGIGITGLRYAPRVQWGIAF